VFLDRDGTVSEYVEYCCRPEDFRLLPWAGQAIRTLNETQLLVVLATNQSAIARGLLTMEGLAAIHEKMRQELTRCGARLDGIYVCPHHPDAGCVCRKPEVGMLRQAAEHHQISLSESYVVGDRRLDVLLGRAANSTTVLVRSGHPLEPANGVVPDHEAPTLLEAVQWILRQEAARAKRAVRRLGTATSATEITVR